MKKQIKTIKMNEVVFDDSIFKPMITATPVDLMFSQEGGIYPATNYMIIGDPGVGKSTLGLDIISNIQKQQPDRKVLFICAEMNRIDMHGYVQRYPKFADIDILFLGEHLDDDTRQILKEILDQGFDLVLTDSFLEVQEAVASSAKLSKPQAEKWIIDLMVAQNLGENNLKKYTSFLMIQQVTKGGEFVGSNKLKHNTTGMCELRFSDQFRTERYISFSKNRRGCQYDRLYFSLESTDDVQYDEKRLKRDLEIKHLIKQEQDTFEKGNKDFEKLFSKQSPETNTDKEPFFNQVERTLIMGDDDIPF
jgi:predicted ATP-dependent serine protease